MNIILTTNNANTGDDDAEGSSENELQANDGNDSCSTNDSLLDQEINNEEEQKIERQNLNHLNQHIFP